MNCGLLYTVTARGSYGENRPAQVTVWYLRYQLYVQQGATVKIALQISGRLRFTEASLNSLVGAIIEPLQPDVFFSFWQPERPTTLPVYQQVLRPCLTEIENHYTIKPYFDDLFTFNVHKNMPSMSYKFYRVNQLRQVYQQQQSVSYDLVIQARSDCVFFEKLTVEQCQRAIDLDAVLCSNQGWNPVIDDHTAQPRMVDNFYLGPTAAIDRANLTFWQLRGQAQEWTAQGLLHHVRIPEIIQTKCWQTAGIKIGSLAGMGTWGNFWYDIDRTETKWL